MCTYFAILSTFFQYLLNFLWHFVLILHIIFYSLEKDFGILKVNE